ncbi:Pre-rRNA-processing protein TSR2-domain-containing protein [Cubamyces lactineus]|nr:Pre-rRNA-processing protein TSR2-domain-containing protein [Cubamyces lactineus]
MSTSASSSTPAAPSQTSILFARGVIARLAYWPALRIAVDQGWGGPESAEKRTWLASVLVDDFEEQDPKPDLDYVEDRLLQVMADEFDTVLEDGSAEAVAKDVVRLWEEVAAGRTELLAEFEERADKLKGKKLQVQVEEAAGDNSDWEDESGDEDEDEEVDEQAPQLLDSQPRPPKEEPEVDADGFITVKGKGKSHR